jgi:hypothetical protein
MNSADVMRVVIAVLVAALGALQGRTTRKVRQVHVLVNGQLSDIKRQLAVMTAKYETAEAEIADQARDPGPHP